MLSVCVRDLTNTREWCEVRTEEEEEEEEPL
jgi:hypothetical protein